MHASKLWIEKWPFEMNPEAASAARPGFFEIVGGVDDVGSGVQHGFKRCGHDRRDVAGGAHLGVLLGRRPHGVSMIAIEQKIGNAVGMHVNQARRNRASRRERVVGRAAGRKDGFHAPVANRKAPVGGSSVTDGDKCGA